jgi:hypothetical protein
MATICNQNMFDFEDFAFTGDQELSSSPAPPSTPVKAKKATVVQPEAPKKAPKRVVHVSPPKQTTFDFAPLKMASWSDATDEEEKAMAQVKKIVATLPWSSRMALADVSSDDLEETLRNELDRKEDLAARVKAAANAEMIRYKKMHSQPPQQRKQVITNYMVQSLLRKDNGRDEDGFSRIPIKSALKRKLAALAKNAKNPDKLKKITSAKWFFFSDDPIMSEEEDLHLWDFTEDEYGNPIPIGWLKVANNTYRIQRNSMFVHVLQPDGSWTHYEEVLDRGAVYTEQVSTQDLRWYLTPANRRHQMMPPLRR